MVCSDTLPDASLPTTYYRCSMNRQSGLRLSLLSVLLLYSSWRSCCFRLYCIGGQQVINVFANKDFVVTRSTASWNSRPLWFRAIVVLAWVNFIAFFVVATYLHGDALNGRAIDGRYFLGWKGTYTEVSRAIFLYSKSHALSMIGTHAAAILSWLFLRRDRR